jgi:hypothetical protein
VKVFRDRLLADFDLTFNLRRHMEAVRSRRATGVGATAKEAALRKAGGQSD